MKSDKLTLAKQIIKEHFDSGDCGLYDHKGWMPDPMTTLYDDGELQIDICYYYSYFEVFGLTDEEFGALSKYYNKLKK